jgi:hypothetical protein
MVQSATAKAPRVSKSAKSPQSFPEPVVICEKVCAILQNILIKPLTEQGDPGFFPQRTATPRALKSQA